MDSTSITAMAVILLIVLAFVFGAIAMNDYYQAKAIEHGAAYYHPQTGDFVWKECGE